jgi:hypothetical protein
MAAELDVPAPPARAIMNPAIKRSPSMATSDRDLIPRDAEEVQTAVATQPAPPPAVAGAEPPAPAITEASAPAQAAPVAPAVGSAAADPAERLREEYAEIAELATQATRLGVSIDVADVLRRRIAAADLRRSVLAYKYFSSTGAQPLREDTRRRFPFGGIVFEEYNATVNRVVFKPGNTKQAKLIARLQRAKGATIDELAETLDWQPHTVRGAIAGALKKKLGLEVTSDKDEKRGRVYRVAG